MKKEVVICDRCNKSVGVGFCSFCECDLCSECAYDFLKIATISSLICEICKHGQNGIDITDSYHLSQALKDFRGVDKFRKSVIEHIKTKRVLEKLDG